MIHRLKLHSEHICTGNQERRKRQIATLGAISITIFSVFNGILALLFRPLHNEPTTHTSANVKMALRHSQAAIKHLETAQNKHNVFFGLNYALWQHELSLNLALDELEDILQPNSNRGIGNTLIRRATKLIPYSYMLDMPNIQFLTHIVKHNKTRCQNTNILSTVEAPIAEGKNITLISNNKFILHSNNKGPDQCYLYQAKLNQQNTIEWPHMKIQFNRRL